MDPQSKQEQGHKETARADADERPESAAEQRPEDLEPQDKGTQVKGGGFTQGDGG